MTDQTLDRIINECPGVDLAGLQVCYVLDGSPRGQRHRYQFKASPDSSKRRVVSTGNWNGYVSLFRLNSEGRLFLHAFDYPSTAQDRVDEEIEGEFWLVLAESYSDYADGKKVFVPFRNGLIVKDRGQWEFAKSEEEIEREAQANAPVSNPLRSLSVPQRACVILGVLLTAFALVYVPFQATYTSPNSGNRYRTNLGYHFVWLPPDAADTCRETIGKTNLTEARARILCFVEPSLPQVGMSAAGCAVGAFAAFLVLGVSGRRR